MAFHNEQLYKETLLKESDFMRALYNPELEFYSCIKEGNIEKIKELCAESLCDKKGLGELSTNPIQSLKYHFTITAALAARYCIEGGLEMSKAYSISDFYINKADACTNAKEISDLHDIMCLDYTVRMNQLSKAKICSLPVSRSIDYINDKLHSRITVTDLANYVNVNPSYLSKIFKKETGMTITDYITKKKIETAKNLLTYSDLSASEIAPLLAFPSQSYFTEVFRKTVGVTPVKYRRENFRSNNLKPI